MRSEIKLLTISYQVQNQIGSNSNIVEIYVAWAIKKLEPYLRYKNIPARFEPDKTRFFPLENMTLSQNLVCDKSVKIYQHKIFFWHCYRLHKNSPCFQNISEKKLSMTIKKTSSYSPSCK